MLQVVELALEGGVIVAVAVAPVDHAGLAVQVPLADAVAGAAVAAAGGLVAGLVVDVGQHPAGRGGVVAHLTGEELEDDLLVAAAEHAGRARGGRRIGGDLGGLHVGGQVGQIDVAGPAVLLHHAPVALGGHQLHHHALGHGHVVGGGRGLGVDPAALAGHDGLVHALHRRLGLLLRGGGGAQGVGVHVAHHAAALDLRPAPGHGQQVHLDPGLDAHVVRMAAGLLVDLGLLHGDHGLRAGELAGGGGLGLLRRLGVVAELAGLHVADPGDAGVAVVADQRRLAVVILHRHHRALFQRTDLVVGLGLTVYLHAAAGDDGLKARGRQRRGHRAQPERRHQRKHEDADHKLFHN